MRAWIASTTDPEKQNVPPFRGGTWQAFYAGGGHCQPVTRVARLVDEAAP
jgi:hypothetical protein